MEVTEAMIIVETRLMPRGVWCGARPKRANSPNLQGPDAKCGGMLNANSSMLKID